MQVLRIGIIGLGWWSDVLAKALAGSQHIQLVACHSRSIDKTKAFADRFCCTPIQKYSDLLSRSDIDGVIITTPNSQHRAGTEAAARAGKHIFLEKPIANTKEDALAIIDVCKQAGVVLSVGHSYRRHSALRQIRTLIDDGTLGRISLAQCVFSKDHGLRLKAEDWRAKNDELPGGCLMQIGIHHIDNLLYLLGPVTEVSAMFSNLQTVGTISDVGTVQMKFANGAIGQVAADYISADRFSLTIFGTNALAIFDLSTGLTLLRRGETAERRIEVTANDYLRDELEEFAICVGTGKIPEVDGWTALKPLEIILAATASAATGSVVKLAQHDAHNGVAHARIG